MKKILTSLFVTMMLIVTNVSGTIAFTKDESYQAAKDYYGKKEVIQGADELITYEALGLESDNLEIEYVVNTDYASTIAKTIIALTLHGDDPRNYEGVNYVEMLENCVQENGAVDKEKDSADANYQYMCVNALYMINSDKTELAADYLASLVNPETGAFGYAGGFDDVAVSAWVIESLTLVNKEQYQPVIEKAIEFIQSKQTETGGYDGYGYGVDSTTQAGALLGLLAYDERGVKENKYSQGENNPFDILLTYQNENGSFWYSEAGEENYYSTVQGAQAIGYYFNGSVYTKAYDVYQKLLKPVDKTEQKPVDDKKDVVETADSHELFRNFSLLIVSAFMIMKGRKYVEQN